MDGSTASSMTRDIPVTSDISASLHSTTSAESYQTARPNQEAVSDAPGDVSQNAAAQLIQRNYRGYRERRQLAGLGLDASTRWTEALKEAQYQNLIKVRSRKDRPIGASPHGAAGPKEGRSFATSEWRRLAQVARRAGNDDTSEESGEDNLPPEQREEWKNKRQVDKKQREISARMMGLEYFLEMVDEKHRYGSHLRSYHAVWKHADTHENFFYWLDYGDGRDVVVPQCSREKLEKDQVRYLTREERYKYLVKFDKQGRLRWAKNGDKISTNYLYRDSIEGIVHKNDPTPAFREEAHGRRHEQQDPAGPSSSSSSGTEDSTQEGKHYVNQELSQAKGVSKVQYVSAAALLNHLLQSTTKKNTWIFVADTSFRLYIGIKQSGAFQHSSFLHGGRISAAGLIKVKDGQLRSLSPLSGHYRPPTRNFRAFVHSLKEAGCDMTRVSISKSYAVLLGLEGYMKTKKQAETSLHEMESRVEKMLHPAEAAKKVEASRDKSESARREKEHLERQARLEEERKRQTSLGSRMAAKLHIGHAKETSNDPVTKS
ncbi:MAG: hypothetical protein M1828_004278 [Chrysothrix sp. TS-e1954]|nr:MAG: hypothetical protein M1828_004278 [Chrysothrix sp. TS-e1954]